MATQTQSTISALEEFSELDKGYEKILQLREAINEEDKFTLKYNLRLAQAHKSNWKLNAHDANIGDELKFYDETINTDITSIESCKEQIKCFKQENKQSLDRKKVKYEEQVLNLEKNFLNAYNEYDTKNLIADTQEYRDKTKNKRQALKHFTQVEGNWREKVRVILENLSNEKVFKFIYDFISTENSDTFEECQLLQRMVKDLKLKRQQHEETIQEFSNQKSKYNF